MCVLTNALIDVRCFEMPQPPTFMTEKKVRTGNPQIEEGHTKIANELLEAINRTMLTAYEYRVLSVIIRNIYGWHGRKDAEISLKEFEQATGIDPRHVSRAIRLLVARNMITRSGSKTGIQKKYREWKEITPPPHKAIRPQRRGVSAPTGGGGTPLGAEDTPPLQAGVYRESKVKQVRKASIKANPSASAKTPPRGAKEKKKFEPSPEALLIMDNLQRIFGIPHLDGTLSQNAKAADIMLNTWTGRFKKEQPENLDPRKSAMEFIIAAMIHGKMKTRSFWTDQVTNVGFFSRHFMKFCRPNGMAVDSGRRGGLYRG